MKPDVLLCVHKQSNVGDVEHVDTGKFAARKKTKHDCAHTGITSVISDPKVYIDEERGLAITWFVVARTYIKARNLAGKTPILRIL